MFSDAPIFILKSRKWVIFKGDSSELLWLQKHLRIFSWTFFGKVFIYWKKSHTALVSLANPCSYEGNQWKIQILTYFVTELEKWTLLHQNQFLEGTTFQITKKISQMIFCESKLNSFRIICTCIRWKVQISQSLCIRRINFLKKSMFYIRWNVSIGLLKTKELKFWGKQRGMRSFALPQFYILMKIVDLSFLKTIFLKIKVTEKCKMFDFSFYDLFVVIKNALSSAYVFLEYLFSIVERTIFVRLRKLELTIVSKLLLQHLLIPVQKTYF